MSAGYGRGYYGDEQLAKPPRRKGSGWVKIALVVGVGAVVWFMWPRRASVPPWPVTSPPSPTPPPLPEALPVQTLPATFQPQMQQLPQPQLALPQAQAPSTSLQIAVAPTQAAQFAQSRGYPSTKEYEDAVVASARQLKDSGAQVVLAPHLAHLALRLGS